MRKSPADVTASRKAADLLRHDRPALEAWMPRQKGLGLPFALVRFQRAGAIDQPSAGHEPDAPPRRGGGAAGRRACRCPARPWSRRRRDAGGGCRSPSREHRAGWRRKAPRRAGSRRSRGSRRSDAGARDCPRAAPGAWPSGRPRPHGRRPAASCAVLPPGAAQRSATRSPGCASRRRAGKAAAASCTHHSPSS